MVIRAQLLVEFWEENIYRMFAHLIHAVQSILFINLDCGPIVELLHIVFYKSPRIPNLLSSVLVGVLVSLIEQE